MKNSKNFIRDYDLIPTITPPPPYYSTTPLPPRHPHQYNEQVFNEAKESINISLQRNFWGTTRIINVIEAVFLISSPVEKRETNNVNDYDNCVEKEESCFY